MDAQESTKSSEPYRSTDYKEKLRLLIIDKVVIALLVLSVAGAGSLILQDHQAKANLAAQYALKASDKYVQAYYELWSDMVDLKNEFKNLIKGERGNLDVAEKFREALYTNGFFLGYTWGSDIKYDLYDVFVSASNPNRTNEQTASLVAPTFCQKWLAHMRQLESLAPVPPRQSMPDKACDWAGTEP